MGLTDKAKELADVALERAGEYAEKASGKAAELSEVARDKAPDFLDRAADAAARAVDAATSGVDKATGGRFHQQLDSAAERFGETIDRGRPSAADVGAAPDLATDVVPPIVTGVEGQDGSPITPASTNPEATTPDAAAAKETP